MSAQRNQIEQKNVKKSPSSMVGWLVGWLVGWCLVVNVAGLDLAGGLVAPLHQFY